MGAVVNIEHFEGCMLIYIINEHEWILNRPFSPVSFAHSLTSILRPKFLYFSKTRQLPPTLVHEVQKEISRLPCKWPCRKKRAKKQSAITFCIFLPSIVHVSAWHCCLFSEIMMRESYKCVFSFSGTVVSCAFQVRNRSHLRS